MPAAFAMRPRGGLEAALIVAVLAVAAAGCGGGSEKAAAGSKIVTVKLTAEGCPESLELPAGPTTFAVSNADARSVSEFEVLDGGTILGEVEDITPGSSRVFSLTLKPGAYRTYCPGGSRTVHGRLTVGSGANALASAAE